MKKFLALCLALLLPLSAALADNVTMNATVVATAQQTVTSSISGKVESVYVALGDHVQAGDRLATLTTTKVYAKEDGTVYIFGQPGDATETIVSRYGAVAYMEPAYTYTISASTRNAYDAEENRLVHPGESVYLRSNQNSKRTGLGVVTVVDGSSFTVEVISGDFESSEQVNIYRDEAYATSSRIGRGSTSRAAMTTYEGSGCVVSYAVENGQSVKKGDLLFETMEGDFIPGGTVTCDILAPVNGVISSLSLGLGSSVSQSSEVAVINPDSGIRLEATLTESDLAQVAIGDRMQAEFTYVSGGALVLPGTVERISRLAADATDDADECSYTVIILPDDAGGLSYGLNAVITPLQ